MYDTQLRYGDSDIRLAGLVTRCSMTMLVGCLGDKVIWGQDFGLLDSSEKLEELEGLPVISGVQGK